MTDAQEKQDTHLPEQHELDIVLELSTAFPQHLPSHMNFSPVESDHREGTWLLLLWPPPALAVHPWVC